MRNRTDRKRKKDVISAKILRVRVARLSWYLERSGATVGEVSGDALLGCLRLKNGMVAGEDSRAEAG